MELQEVIKSFEDYDGKYKREEVDYALDHQEEITPHLIKILQNVLNNPIEYAANENYFGHIYALLLLGFFKEIKAHQFIIDIISLPDDIIEDLFGEVLSENLPMVLYQTCGGSLENIRKLILNISAPDRLRTAAASSVIYAVVNDIISREEALNFLSQLFTGNETEKNSNFWSFLACDICDICPDEKSLKIIQNAYSKGLIYSGIVGYEEFTESVSLGVKGCFEQIKQCKLYDIPDSFHDIMSWWACFDENQPPVKDILTSSIFKGKKTKAPIGKKKKRK